MSELGFRNQSDFDLKIASLGPLLVWFLVKIWSDKNLILRFLGLIVCLAALSMYSMYSMNSTLYSVLTMFLTIVGHTMYTLPSVFWSTEYTVHTDHLLITAKHPSQSSQGVEGRVKISHVPGNVLGREIFNEGGILRSHQQAVRVCKVQCLSACLSLNSTVFSAIGGRWGEYSFSAFPLSLEWAGSHFVQWAKARELVLSRVRWK